MTPVSKSMNAVHGEIAVNIVEESCLSVRNKVDVVRSVFPRLFYDVKHKIRQALDERRFE